MAAHKKRRSPKKKTAAEPKKGKHAYRVDAWFTGVSGSRSIQTDKPGWRPRGTYAVRKLAVLHKNSIERAEKVSTRIVAVSA